MYTDDIPIQDDQQPASEVPLDSITEEQEETEKGKSRGSVSALKHLPKLPGLSKKHKIKQQQQHQAGGDQQTALEMNTNASTGDQMNDSPSNDSNHTVHVSAV